MFALCAGECLRYKVGVETGTEVVVYLTCMLSSVSGLSHESAEMWGFSRADTPEVSGGEWTDWGRKADPRAE